MWKVHIHAILLIKNLFYVCLVLFSLYFEVYIQTSTTEQKNTVDR